MPRQNVHDSSPAISGRILLAEDSEANQMVARTILESSGCAVSLANNGAKALELAARERFDVIFMDVSMPGMDGLEATRRIRALPGDGSGVPIVAMTANVMAQDRDRCLQAGMDDFVAKPISVQGLRDCLQRWLARGVALHKSNDEDRELAGQRETGRQVMNRAVLKDMARQTSEQVVGEIVGIFIRETRERLRQLHGLSAHVDSETLVSAGHAIKSSAATFGAERLQDAAQKLEALARMGEIDRAVAAIETILESGEEAMQAFTEQYG
jgi:CheY-like chemotaxis protein/HPt (histidine-containing phosphotransfer) domain-containing protein